MPYFSRFLNSIFKFLTFTILKFKHTSDVQKRNIGVKLKNLFKNQFLLELSQKVKEIGSYLEIMSFRSIRTHFKQIFYYPWCNAATAFFCFLLLFFL